MIERSPPRALQNLTLPRRSRKASLCRINYLALDIFIILLYQYMLQVRQDEHHGLATWRSGWSGGCCAIGRR